MSYEILSHTADLRMRVSGKNLEDLFRSALLGMKHIMKESVPDNAKINKRVVRVSSPDRTALLVDFLNEVLYFANANKEVYADIDFKKLSPTELEAEILGYKVAEFDEDIKAATYHEAEIRETKSGELETIIVFDI